MINPETKTWDLGDKDPFRTKKDTFKLRKYDEAQNNIILL